MTTLTVTDRGQVTFRKDILEHLGIRPGDKLRLERLPDGRAQLKADQPGHAWRHLHGMLAGKGNGARCSIDEIAQAGSAMATLDRP